MRFITDRTIGEDARPDAAWYALCTRHQHEKNVAGSLSSRGFEVFLPLHEEIRSWSDRRKRLHLPLFSCYVFVRSSLDRKMDILVTSGVHAFVSFDGNPAPIPHSEIEDLRRVIQAARIEPHPFLRYGDWVRVKSGPFEGIEGFLVRRKRQARLVLSVEMLEKSVAMEIDAVLTERIWRSNFARKTGSMACSAGEFGTAG
ncbi:MAG TPA: UpxY family transcription antiterminator [Patescibacteria group bacterium]|nr:UpxY family transcription antiterminator [Patescibacteria group bacterium]